MISLHVVVAIANVDLGKASMSEEGCKYMCEHFQGPILIKLGPMIIGKVLSMEYRTDTKEAVAEVQVGFTFKPQGQIVQSLETLEGKRIMAATLEEMFLEPEEVKIDSKESLDGRV